MNENIEKVLAALDGFRMNDEMTYSAYSVLHDEISLLDDLLKAQEPVEPLAEYSVHTGSKWAICGKCHEPLAKASDKEMPNYCPFCGREMKWDG